jgi:N-acetylmuramoyl-L-alanine amidase
MALSVISKLNRLGLPIANDWNTENTQGILQRVNTVGATYPDGSQADYYTLLYCGTEAGLPTIIIEHAFLSNENDYRNFLCTNDKLDALAKADAEGIIESIR